MKRATRSAAAVLGTTVLAGAGIAAAVTGVSGPSTPETPARSASSAASAEPALSAAVQELLNRSAALHDRLDATHHQLHVLDRRLHHERQLTERLVRQRAARSAKSAVGQVLPGTSVATTPGVHTSTRASGIASRPGVHATTRASGAGAASVHTTTRASGSSAPGVHTTTRASAGHGDDHESGSKHDD